MVRKPGDSRFSVGLMEVKKHLLAGGKFIVQSGNQTRFWEDYWIGVKQLTEKYPTLYTITREKE